jgi:hypothetical protein
VYLTEEAFEWGIFLLGNWTDIRHILLEIKVFFSPWQAALFALQKLFEENYTPRPIFVSLKCLHITFLFINSHFEPRLSPQHSRMVIDIF